MPQIQVVKLASHPKMLTAKSIKLHKIFRLSNGSAGSRTIDTLVTNSGVDLSRYRARKAMQNLGLVSKQPSAPKYKKANNEHLAAPNILVHQLNVATPNEVWCGDVTHTRVGKQWAYLAAVLDLYSRKPIGWTLSLSPDSNLTNKALLQAYELQGAAKKRDVLFRSRGCITPPGYCSQLSPHQHNIGQTSNRVERLFFEVS